MATPPTIRPQKINFGPQPGPQTEFFQSTADIVIYGGSAGSGKSFALLLEPLRHVYDVTNFNAVIFRRTTPQITNPGGLWDEARGVYPLAGGRGRASPHLEYRWPNHSSVRFASLNHEDTVFEWHGAQVVCLCFDELTGAPATEKGTGGPGFSYQQFFYMVSRNRSTCGVKPYIRATCNPNADSWVADFIAWWIDQETGFPIPERAGIVRYFVRGPADQLIWADTPEPLLSYLPKPEELPEGTEAPEPKSVTFIPASIYDNPALLRKNPEYLASLQVLPEVERQRLLLGNWKIRPSAGLYFRRGWCTLLDFAPPGLTMVRYWDLAGTPKTELNDPDWTVGVKLGKDVNNFLYVLDVTRMREGPFEVEQAIRNTAEADGFQVTVGFGLDPGQAGKWQAAYLTRGLLGHVVEPARETGDKVTRFGPFSSQCKAGNVKILRADWNEAFFRALEGFPDVAHDDDVDAAAGALELILENAADFGMWARLAGIAPETLNQAR